MSTPEPCNCEQAQRLEQELSDLKTALKGLVEGWKKYHKNCICPMCATNTCVNKIQEILKNHEKGN